MSDVQESSQASVTLELSPIFKEYEDGKHRRYELLFKANGAAFAIVTLATDVKTGDLVYQIIGLRLVAVLMAAFSLVMGADILTFGWKMSTVNRKYWNSVEAAAQSGQLNSVASTRRRWLPRLSRPSSSGMDDGKGDVIFGPAGKIVLAVIVGLLLVGWCSVAARAPDRVPQTAAQSDGVTASMRNFCERFLNDG
jgi:hypothetical protein